MNRSTLRAFAAIASLMAGLGCAESPSAPPAAVAGPVHLLRDPASAPFHASRSGSSGTASAVIGPDGGSIVLGGNRIDFPAGALAEPTTITMRGAPAMYGVQLEPHGLTFPAGSEPVLTVAYSRRASAGLTRMAIVYVDDRMTILEVLPTQWNAQDHTLTAALHHFSGYLAGGG